MLNMLRPFGLNIIKWNCFQVAMGRAHLLSFGFNVQKGE